MSSKEQLKNALKRANSVNQKLSDSVINILRTENEKLKKQIRVLELRIKCDKSYCKLYHKEKITARISIWWKGRLNKMKQMKGIW